MFVRWLVLLQLLVCVLALFPSACVDELAVRGEDQQEQKRARTGHLLLVDGLVALVFGLITFTAFIIIRWF